MKSSYKYEVLCKCFLSALLKKIIVIRWLSLRQEKHEIWAFAPLLIAFGTPRSYSEKILFSVKQRSDFIGGLLQGTKSIQNFQVIIYQIKAVFL